MTNEKENTCTWQVIPMGEWTLFRASCGVAKYTKKRGWSGVRDSADLDPKDHGTTCENCGGVVLLEPNLDPKGHGTVVLES